MPRGARKREAGGSGGGGGDKANPNRHAGTLKSGEFSGV